MDLREEDANISTFRRGNKIIAIGLALLIICVTLLILTDTVASAFLLPPILNAHLPRPSLISVELFCPYSDTQMCITTLNSIVPDRTEPDSRALHPNSSQRSSKFDPLRSGSDRIRESLARPKLPFLRRVRDEVESDIRYCLGESPEVEARLECVRVYVYSAYGFVAKREAGTNNSFNVETHSQINYFGAFRVCVRSCCSRLASSAHFLGNIWLDFLLLDFFFPFGILNDSSPLD